ncbi:helix-turn-helix transcriptional regulator [Brevundimonas sp.]|uniref:helix-turn-helix domain-containing protein n=1 Tax=Brevundimonas sp. TaxID=1871086 RepID=UPI002D1FACE9|nr:helix-turn-helix transcriptional regulator [Brevundimonas sp.]
MDIRKRVGENVRRLRVEAGLSQEQFAFEADMHRTYVSGVERGIRNPTVTVLERMAKALKVKPESLLAYTPPISASRHERTLALGLTTEVGRPTGVPPAKHGR